MRWNEEQLTAINAVDKNITVSASAGAGKTAVLVARLVKRIIDDKVSIDTIVALTFTEAAAAEMKNRLILSLNDELQKNPDNDYLQQQISLVADANITTIHSFCLSLLKNHYYMLNMTPESLNNILTEADIAKIKETAFESTFESSDSEDLKSLQQQLSNSSYGFHKLEKIVSSLVEEASTKTDPLGWLDLSLKGYQKFQSLDDIPTLFKDLFFEIMTSQTEQLRLLTHEILRVIDTLQADHNVDKQREWINNIYQQLNPLQEALRDCNYNLYRQLMIEIAEVQNPALRGNELYKGYREQMNSLMKDMVAFLYPEEILLADLNALEQDIHVLIDFSKRYYRAYQEGITDAGGITFNDMETLTYKLLTMNNHEVAKELRHEFEDILVDEFQDTNILQNEIITLISRGNNVFRVGDVKQSIYRFRGAKPNIMQDLIDMGDTDTHMTINLRHNYRSKNAIVEYNNHVFNDLMNLDLFSGSYTENDHVSVGVDQQQEDSEPVELHLINSDKEAYEFDENQSNNELKANYIAYCISKYHQQNPNARWNDYVVLVQSNQQKEYLRQAFESVNIPYFISMPDGFYDSKGVSTMVSYLHFIAYNDEISLMAILINLYGYSEDEVVTCYLNANKDLYKATKLLNTEILEGINHYRKNTDIKITEIIDDACMVNNYYEEKISKLERTNLDLFYDTAKEYDDHHLGIFGFLNIIDQMKDEKTSEAIALTPEDDVVNVMTFHNSKGLQFDTVFIWSKSLRRSHSASEGFLIDSDAGLAMKTTLLPERIVRDNIVNYTLNYKETLEEYEEEMRTLYVAMTRAQRRMVIVDVYNFEKESQCDTFDYTNILDNIGFTGWLKGIHETNPSQYFNIQSIESFEPIINDRISQKVIPLQKLKPTKAQYEDHDDHFESTPLDFNNILLGTDTGTEVHHTIERLKDQDWSKETIKTLSPSLNDYYVNRIFNLGQQPLMKRFLTMDAYYERPFVINQEGRVQQRIIDFLAVDQQDVYIVDFKTDALETEQEFVDRYHKQLETYYHAMTLAYSDKTIHAYIYSFKLETFITII